MTDEQIVDALNALKKEHDDVIAEVIKNTTREVDRLKARLGAQEDTLLVVASYLKQSETDTKKKTTFDEAIKIALNYNPKKK